MKRALPPIPLQVGPSERIGTFVVITHLYTFGTILWLVIERPLFLLLLPLLAISLVRSWRRYVRGGHHLVLYGSGEWHLSDGDGQSRKARLLGDSRVWSGLMILNFRIEGVGRRSLILLSDNSDAEQRRRLRVRLVSVSGVP